ncbi:MAG: RsbRD N-terminal domain-containing protein, partial [Candidatus Binataceae bacterium]
MENDQSHLHAILKQHEGGILTDWLSELALGSKNDRRISETELSNQAREFLTLVLAASATNNSGIGIESARWAPVRDFLEGISRSRAQQGFTSAETATFIFSFKKPLFERLRKEWGNNPQELAAGTWEANELLDKLGLHTVQIFQKAREAIISRQQEELLELSTPVVKLWEGILALPMIG